MKKWTVKDNDHIITTVIRTFFKQIQFLIHYNKTYDFKG